VTARQILLPVTEKENFHSIFKICPLLGALFKSFHLLMHQFGASINKREPLKQGREYM
jgi:hypothetical protein